MSFASKARADANGVPASKPPDIRKMGYLRKLKTMKKKFFVLHEETGTEPARLEYYDTEKKWKSGSMPKRTIVLKTCFNINRKLDTKQKHAIALYTKDDCFSIVMDNEEELEEWLASLLELQHGEDSLLSDELPKPTFEHVWQVSVRNKGLASSRNILGSYHLCLTCKTLSLMKLNTATPSIIEFSLSQIRRCGHSYCFFFMELGRSAPTGAGELWMQTEDVVIAQNMHEAILNAMRSAKDDLTPRQRSRSSSTNESSKPISVHVRRQTTVAVPGLMSGISPSINRDRADSFPCRPRTVSDGIASRQMQPQLSLDIQRPHSMYSRAASYSPPTGSLLPSPGSAPYTTDSAGSSLSNIDDHDGLQFDFWGSHFMHSTPDSAQPTEPSISEENHSCDEYITMSPTARQRTGGSKAVEEDNKEYMDMASPSSISKSVVMTSSRTHTPSRSGGHGRVLTSQLSKSPSEQGDYLEMGSSAADSPSGSEGYMRMSPLGSSFPDVPTCKPPTPVKSYMAMSPTRSSSVRYRKTSLDDRMSVGYVPMAPLTSSQKSKDDTGYMDMTPLSQQLGGTQPTVGSYLEMSPGTPSKDTGFGEFHMEAVQAYLTNDIDEDEKPVRANSVGSKPECRSKTHNRNSHLDIGGETSRARAFSVGSKVGLQFRKQPGANDRKTTRDETSAQGKKSSSAPLLSSSWSGTSCTFLKGTTSTDDRENADLMELDFARNRDVNTRRSEAGMGGCGEARNSVTMRPRSNSRSSGGRPSKLDSLHVIGEKVDRRSTLPTSGGSGLEQLMKKSPTVGSYTEMTSWLANSKGSGRSKDANTSSTTLPSKVGDAEEDYVDMSGTKKDDSDRVQDSKSNPSLTCPLHVQVEPSGIVSNSPPSSGEYVNIDLSKHFRRKGVVVSPPVSSLLVSTQSVPSSKGVAPLKSKSAVTPKLDAKIEKIPPSCPKNAEQRDYMNLQVGSTAPALQPLASQEVVPSNVLANSDSYVHSSGSALVKPVSRTMQSIVKIQKQMSAPASSTQAVSDFTHDSGVRKISMPSSLLSTVSKPSPVEGASVGSGQLLLSTSPLSTDKLKGNSPQGTPSGGSQSSLSSGSGVGPDELHQSLINKNGSPVFIGGALSSQNIATQSRLSISEAPYENISFGNTRSRPSSVSSERELNYASLDLAPTTAGEEDEKAPPSPLLPKSVSTNETGSVARLSYAKIDFTKSEGLRTTCNTVREIRQ